MAADEPWQVSLRDAVAAIPSEGMPYAEVIRHGTLRVGFYTPRGSDPQQPHEQDGSYSSRAK